MLRVTLWITALFAALFVLRVAGIWLRRAAARTRRRSA
jgi:hypothetical protein